MYKSISELFVYTYLTLMLKKPHHTLFHKVFNNKILLQICIANISYSLIDSKLFSSFSL